MTPFNWETWTFLVPVTVTRILPCLKETRWGRGRDADAALRVSVVALSLFGAVGADVITRLPYVKIFTRFYMFF